MGPLLHAVALYSRLRRTTGGEVEVSRVKFGFSIEVHFKDRPNYTGLFDVFPTDTWDLALKHALSVATRAIPPLLEHEEAELRLRSAPPLSRSQILARAKTLKELEDVEVTPDRRAEILAEWKRDT